MIETIYEAALGDMNTMIKTIKNEARVVTIGEIHGLWRMYRKFILLYITTHSGGKIIRR